MTNKPSRRDELAELTYEMWENQESFKAGYDAAVEDMQLEIDEQCKLNLMGQERELKLVKEIEKRYDEAHALGFRDASIKCQSDLALRDAVISKMQKVLKRYSKDTEVIYGEIDKSTNTQAIDWVSVWDEGESARDCLAEVDKIMDEGKKKESL